MYQFFDAEITIETFLFMVITKYGAEMDNFYRRKLRLCIPCLFFVAILKRSFVKSEHRYFVSQYMTKQGCCFAFQYIEEVLFFQRNGNVQSQRGWSH